jgi:proteasome accessory factor A
MFDRLIGQETEYAIRVELIRDGGARPPNDLVFSKIADCIEARFDCLPGRTRSESRRLFLENGGTVYYETLPHAVDAGLVEAATPECRSPSQLLLYQRAQDELVREAAREAFDHTYLRNVAAVRLIKNCRDGYGNVYGTHENFEATMASGWRLTAYRAGLIALLPVILAVGLLIWTLGLTFLLGVLAVTLPLMLSIEFLGWPRAGSRVGRWLTGMLDADDRRFENWVGRVLFALSETLSPPMILPFALLLRLFCFREIRQGATGFLISRCVLTGAGTVEDDGSFRLSERAGAMRRLTRISLTPDGRGIYDFGNLYKLLTGITGFRGRDYVALFAPTQRLQLGLTDANACQFAEYLKIATTTLVLDMAEDGALEDAPQFDDELEILRAFNADSSLQTTVRTLDGRTMSVLDVQRWYLERARVYVSEKDAPSMEAFEVLDLWEEMLDTLQQDPERLVGRIDWVTKKYFLDRSTDRDDVAARKKLSVKYHELGDGYHARLEREGLSPRLVDPEELQTAMTTPPQDTPAVLRSRIIRRLQDSDEKIAVDWTSVKVGGAIRGKLVELEDFRLD